MSDWLEWRGDKCPQIEGLRCDIRLRDGTELLNENSYDWWDDWNWRNRQPEPSDIVAYRAQNVAAQRIPA